MRLFASAILMISMNLSAQIQYIHHSGQAMIDVDLISPKQILSHHVRSIRAKYATKYDGELMQLNKKEVFFDFNEKGYLIKAKERNHYRHKADSLVHRYFYKAPNYLSAHVVFEPQGNTVFTFENKGDHHLLAAYLIPRELLWNEHLSPEYRLWQDSLAPGTNGRFTSYNEFGKAYKYLIERRDEHSQLTGIDEYQYGGKLVCAYYYQRDAEQRLTHIEARPNNKYLFPWRKEFTYDDHGRLSEVRYFKNDRLETYRRISYGENDLPEIDITRNEVTTKMDIVKYEYSYVK